MNLKDKKMIILMSIFSLFLSFLICSDSIQAKAITKKLKATVPTNTIAVNQTITLKTNVKSIFKSSNRKIATVNSKGIIKGRKAGTVRIIVVSKKDKSQKKTLKIKVKNKLTVLAPKEGKASLQVDENTKIKTNLPAVFKSSNESIATVSSTGVVTAKAEGTVIITVISKKYKKLKKNVLITVKNKQITEDVTPTTQEIKDNNTSEQTKVILPDKKRGESVVTIPNKKAEDFLDDNIKQNEGVSDDREELQLSGKVREAENDSPLSNVNVYLVPISSYSDNVDIEGCNTTKTDQNGEYIFSELEKGLYCVVTSYTGRKQVVQYVDLSELYAGEHKVEDVYMTSDRNNNLGTVSGRIRDIDSYIYLEGITIELRLNMGNVGGNVIAETVTDKNGCFSFSDLEAGNYTITVKDDSENHKYISDYRNICVGGRFATTDINIDLSQILDDGVVRFIFRYWSNSSENAGAFGLHLYGPAAPNRVDKWKYQEVWDYTGYVVDYEVFTGMDLGADSCDPEVIDILTPLDGKYYLFVANELEQGSSDYISISDINAYITVLSGNKRKTVFYKTSTDNDKQEWWKICSYDPVSDVLTEYNELSDHVELDGKNMGDSTEGLDTCDHGTFFSDNLISIQTDNEDLLYIDSMWGGATTRYYKDEREKKYYLTPSSIDIVSDLSWDEIKPHLTIQAASGYRYEMQDVNDMWDCVARIKVCDNDTNNIVLIYNIGIVQEIIEE